VLLWRKIGLPFSGLAVLFLLLYKYIKRGVGGGEVGDISGRVVEKAT